MNKKLLSIIIPTLNEEKSLSNLLRSINKQVGVRFEIIVADNNSKDSTRQIASSYDAKVVSGGPPSQARNNGALAARGDTLLFLDADVILPAPDFLKKNLSEFKRHKFDMATCAFCPMSEKIIDRLFHQVANFYIRKVNLLLPHAPGFCIFIRKKVHDRIDGFDEDLKLAEDHDYAKRAGKVAKLGFLKSYPILVSVRRFKRDGHFNVAAKYILCEMHMILKGPVRSDIFKYRFGYSE